MLRAAARFKRLSRGLLNRMSSSLVEVYLPESEDITKFHSLPLSDKCLVISLGMSLYDSGTARLEEIRKCESSDLNAEVLREHEMRIAAVKIEEQAKYAEARVHFSQVKADLEERLDSTAEENKSIVTRIQSEHSRRETETREYYERKLTALRDELEASRTKHEEYLSNLAIRSAKSCSKGQDGETEVFARLNMLFPCAEIEDTHSTPGRGDFILRDEGLSMMIESKNYSRNVQKAEIDKFYRDVESPGNSDVQCAVLVSLESGVSAREDFAFEVRGDKPVLFIHHLSDNYDQLRVAVKFFKLGLGDNNIDLSKKETTDSLKNTTCALQRILKKQKQKVDKFYKDMIELGVEQEAHVLEVAGLLGR